MANFWTLGSVKLPQRSKLGDGWRRAEGWMASSGLARPPQPHQSQDLRREWRGEITERMEDSVVRGDGCMETELERCIHSKGCPRLLANTRSKEVAKKDFSEGCRSLALQTPVFQTGTFGTVRQ